MNTQNRFCCACLPSVAEYADLALRSLPDELDEDRLNRFLVAESPRFLAGIGDATGKHKTLDVDAISRYFRVLGNIARRPFLQDTLIYADNGAFQISKGWLRRDLIPPYAREYGALLRNEHASFHRAFILDLVPSPTACVFHGPLDLLRLNMLTYQAAASLPDEARGKMVAICHFRGPTIFSIWQKILFEARLAGSFEHFATGGLAVARGTNAALPCNPLAIPLVPILLHARSRGMQSLEFHVLGQSEWQEILCYCLVERHVRQVLGLELRLTHDSSSVFKKGLKSRQFVLGDMQCQRLRIVSMHSPAIHVVTPGYGSHNEQFYCAANEALTPYGIGPFDAVRHPFYIGYSTTQVGYFLGIMTLLHVYNAVCNWCEALADTVYPMYRAGDRETFQAHIAAFLGRLHENRAQADLEVMAESMTNTLDMLTQLDPEYCTYLVGQHLAGHEHPLIRESSAQI